MYGAADWRQKKYDEVYEQELRGLERRRSEDPACTLADLEATLRHMYASQGADWVGRGELQDTIMNASIAAWESFIERWKVELREVAK